MSEMDVSEQPGLLTPGQRQYLSDPEQYTSVYSRQAAHEHKTKIQTRLKQLGSDLSLIATSYDHTRTNEALSGNPIPEPGVKMVLEYSPEIWGIHPLSGFLVGELRDIQFEMETLADRLEEYDKMEYERDE